MSSSSSDLEAVASLLSAVAKLKASEGGRALLRGTLDAAAVATTSGGDAPAAPAGGGLLTLALGETKPGASGGPVL